VRLLGTRAIGEMATALAALQMFDTNSAQGVALKDHATAVAAVGRHLASKLGLPVDDVYTCGLLHDIGKLFLLQDSWSNYEGLCDGKDPDCAHDHERERYGYDHAVLAGHILKNWQIPDPVPTVVAWHHQFARAVNEGGPKARLVALVRLADAIIYALDGDAEVEVPKLAQMQEAEYLELSESQLSEWWLELHTVADENREKKTAQEQPQALPPVPEVTGEKDAKSFEKTAGPNKKTAWLGLGLAIGGIAAIIGVVALLFR
jgi:putative nucleotidyltransferase with HDIG domain